MPTLIELEENYRAIIGQPSLNYEKFRERYLAARGILLVSFKAEIISDSKKQCYSRLIKLCELWFAFEKFLSILVEQEFVTNETASKPSMITDELVNRFELNELINNFSLEISMIFETPQKKKKIKFFINHLHLKGDDRQKRLLNSAEGRIDTLEHNNFKIQEILSMIYGIRNLHVHDGDTFIDIMKSFPLTKDFLDTLVEFLDKLTEMAWKQTIELIISKFENE